MTSREGRVGVHAESVSFCQSQLIARALPESHPRCPYFESLGLRCHAVPTKSNLVLPWGWAYSWGAKHIPNPSKRGIVMPFCCWFALKINEWLMSWESIGWLKETAIFSSKIFLKWNKPEWIFLGYFRLTPENVLRTLHCGLTLQELRHTCNQTFLNAISYPLTAVSLYNNIWEW